MEGKSYVLRQKEIGFDPRPKVCARLEHILKIDKNIAQFLYYNYNWITASETKRHVRTIIRIQTSLEWIEKVLPDEKYDDTRDRSILYYLTEKYDVIMFVLRMSGNVI